MLRAHNSSLRFAIFELYLPLNFGRTSYSCFWLLNNPCRLAMLEIMIWTFVPTILEAWVEKNLIIRRQPLLVDLHSYHREYRQSREPSKSQIKLGMIIFVKKCE